MIHINHIQQGCTTRTSEQKQNKGLDTESGVQQVLAKPPSLSLYSLSTLYSLLFTLYSLLSTLYSLLFTLYSLLFTIYSLLSTLYSLLCTLLYSVLCCTLHSAVLCCYSLLALTRSLSPSLLLCYSVTLSLSLALSRSLLLPLAHSHSHSHSQPHPSSSSPNHPPTKHPPTLLSSLPPPPTDLQLFQCPRQAPSHRDAHTASMAFKTVMMANSIMGGWVDGLIVRRRVNESFPLCLTFEGPISSSSPALLRYVSCFFYFN